MPPESIILLGDVRERLAELPEASVQCCITSPPYWGLRKYLVDNAVVLRYDLTPEEKTFVLSELNRHGVQPHS
jgi:DNA modification methylase